MTKISYSLAFILLLAACSGKKESAQTDNNNEKNSTFLSTVKTVNATFSDQEVELTLTGQVDFDPEKVIHYVPLVQGVVEQTHFSLDDKVKKGQALLDLKSADVSALFSNMVSLKSDMEVAQRDLQSAEGLYSDKLLSDKDILESKSKFLQAQVAYEKAQSDMSLYQSKGAGVFSILAPMTGYVVDKQVASGSPISPDGGALFTIADLSVVWIIVNVYAGDLQFVQEGMPVEITTLAYPGEVFDGKINAISQVFDPEEKVLKARIIMSNENLKFKPEMSVVVRLKNTKAEKQITIPSKALIFDDNKYFVVVEQSPGNFKIRPVELGGNYEQMSYIRSGLEAGEKVVVENQLLIYSGLNDK